MKTKRINRAEFESYKPSLIVRCDGGTGAYREESLFIGQTDDGQKIRLATIKTKPFGEGIDIEYLKEVV